MNVTCWERSEVLVESLSLRRRGSTVLLLTRSFSGFLQNTDLPDQVKLSKLQKGSFVFQLKVTDTDGQSADDRVRVLVLSPEQSGCKCSWEM